MAVDTLLDTVQQLPGTGLETRVPWEQLPTVQLSLTLKLSLTSLRDNINGTPVLVSRESLACETTPVHLYTNSRVHYVPDTTNKITQLTSTTASQTLTGEERHSKFKGHCNLQIKVLSTLYAYN